MMRHTVDETDELAQRVRASIEKEGLGLVEALRREGFVTRRDFGRAYKRLRRAGWQYHVVSATLRRIPQTADPA